VAWLYEAQRILAPAVRWYFRMRAVGSERIPEKGGLILCPNHASFLDPWFVGYALLERSWRNLIDDDWYDRNPLFRAFFRAWGTIPTSTGRPEVTVGRVVDAVGGGAAVIVYPEGRISHDGTLGRGRRGVSLIAAATGAPVIPCGIRGNFRALPRQRRIPRREAVEIHVGTPMRFPGSPTDARPARQATDAFTRELMARIADLGNLEPFRGRTSDPDPLREP
jgi:1-acyl-sn-glycerol-3-phosphate acyltransferase